MPRVPDHFDEWSKRRRDAWADDSPIEFTSKRRETINFLLPLLVGGGAFALALLAFFAYADIANHEERDMIESSQLETISCEQMGRILTSDFMFTDLLSEAAQPKWNEMKCDNPNSSYWRGIDWKYNETPQGIIESVDKK